MQPYGLRSSLSLAVAACLLAGVPPVALAAPAAAAPKAAAAPAVAKSATEDIQATCKGDTPVITRRPPGTEHITVRCVDGLPEFVVQSAPVPVYDPVKRPLPQVVPPDFGAWVTVWLNGHPLKTPYNPVRKITEPGAYLARSTGRVMMPIRFFTEAFGGKVQWFQSERRVHLSMPGRSAQADVWVEKSFAKVGDRWVPLDQTSVLFADRVFVPVRFLAEAVGAEVTWDRANRSVRVQLDGLACMSAIYCGEVR